MNYYKVHYKLGKNGAYIYPENIKDVVLRNSYSHCNDKVFIAESDAKIDADDKSVILLTEEEATALITEFQNSFPEPPPEEDFMNVPEQGRNQK